MFFTQNIDPSVTTKTFESNPPQPPLDLLMDVETYNIGIEGMGEGNKIMHFTSHVQHYHTSHLQSIAQQALVSL